MKTIQLFAATIATALASAAFATSAAEKTIKVDVDGLVCAFCAQGIEKKMKAQPATARVLVSLEKKVALVALKDGQDIADDKIRSEITDAGYVVKGITRSEESFDVQRAKIKAAKS